MKRGFTIVELMVVVAVIAILVAIATSTYSAYQDRSYDSQTKSLASAVRAGAEEYYGTNNEYPLASIVFGGNPTGNPPANYTTASSVLGVPTTTLNSDKVQFIPCAGTCAVTDTSKVYYLTKTATDNATLRQYTISGCTYTFPTTENGALSYIIAYYSLQESKWKISSSNKGDVTTSNTTTCPFTAL